LPCEWEEGTNHPGHTLEKDRQNRYDDDGAAQPEKAARQEPWNVPSDSRLNTLGIDRRGTRGVLVIGEGSSLVFN
jgi:hypothetical protein